MNWGGLEYISPHGDLFYQTGMYVFVVRARKSSPCPWRWTSKTTARGCKILRVRLTWPTWLDLWGCVNGNFDTEMSCYLLWSIGILINWNQVVKRVRSWRTRNSYIRRRTHIRSLSSSWDQVVKRVRTWGTRNFLNVVVDKRNWVVRWLIIIGLIWRVKNVIGGKGRWVEWGSWVL